MWEVAFRLKYIKQPRTDHFTVREKNTFFVGLKFCFHLRSRCEAPCGCLLLILTCCDNWCRRWQRACPHLKICTVKIVYEKKKHWFFVCFWHTLARSNWRLSSSSSRNTNWFHFSPTQKENAQNQHEPKLNAMRTLCARTRY